jgi:transposase
LRYRKPQSIRVRGDAEGDTGTPLAILGLGLGGEDRAGSQSGDGEGGESEFAGHGCLRFAGGGSMRMIADNIEALLTDKGYDADAIREEMEAAEIEVVIPAKRNRKNPAPHDAEKYKWRNLIERLFSKLKNWRRVATPTTKSKKSYLGFVAIAAVKLWLPFVHEA